MISIAAPLSFFAAVILAASPLAVAPALPMAQHDTITWSVEPADTNAGARPTFEYSSDPGTQINDVVVITNFGSNPADFRVYATDGINDFETGGLGLLAGDQKPVDLGAWITVDVPQLRLEPGMQARVPFSAVLPSDAAPGDHVAGIVASSVTTGENNGQAVVLDQRVGARVNLRVSGTPAVRVDTAGLVAGFSPSWNPFAPGTMSVDYAVANRGNIRLDVNQTINVVGPFGVSLGTVTPGPIKNILPGQSVHVTAELPAIAALAIAWSSVDLVPAPVAGAATGDPAAPIAFSPSSGSTVSIAVSWTLLLLVVLLVVVAFLIWRYVRGTRERMYNAIDEAAAAAREQADRDGGASESREEVSAR